MTKCIDCNRFEFPCPENAPKKPNPNTIGWGFCERWNEKYLEKANGCKEHSILLRSGKK